MTTKRKNFRKSGSSRRLELTVYQAGQSVIRETRELQLVTGKNSVQLDGLPTAFVENSLVVLGAKGPGQYNIGSTSYEPANMNGSTILQKAIGTKVTLIEANAQAPVRTSGILRFVLGNQVVLEQDGAMVVLPLTPKFELGEGMPGGLANTPSLVLEPSVTEPGKYQVRFLYEADNITWTPRYNAFFDQDAGKLTRFECVVDITNESGLEIEDGVFKLFTGANYGQNRRNSAKAYGARPMAMAAMAPRGGGAALESVSADDAGVETVGEQKLYVLPDALSIGATATKNTNLFLTEDVPVQVEFFLPAGYYGQAVAGTEEDSAKLPVNVRLRIKNDEASNMGKNMPAGEVAFFVYDSTGTEQKVDSAAVPARAKNEPFKLELRKPSADVKASRRLTFFHQDQPEPEQPDPTFVPEGGMPDASEGGPTTMSMRPAVVAAPQPKVVKPLFREEEREVTIFNYKDTDVEVVVNEQFPDKAEFIKRPEFVDANTSNGTLRLTVAAKGKATVSYRIKYRIN